ncbi:hypothetical protein TIFTF001_044195 [Ficus carica]|uniref:Uncharacterized protein n=1 Tax=Ficus carica TaxID=3494 RepID=A0AA88CR83_FICCA|nr:hypothetical protein TIFTF001_044195 [Ficus carica]
MTPPTSFLLSSSAPSTKQKIHHCRASQSSPRHQPSTERSKPTAPAIHRAQQTYPKQPTTPANTERSKPLPSPTSTSPHRAASTGQLAESSHHHLSAFPEPAPFTDPAKNDNHFGH